MRDRPVNKNRKLTKDEEIRRSKEIPLDESGERPAKPSDERNSDQGKMQASYDAQKHERGTKAGDKQMPQ